MKKQFLMPFVILLTMFIVLPANAGWNNFVVNFDKKDFGYGTNTWRISSKGNWTYFANQKALLQYNGITWSRFELNNRSEVRGVAVSSRSGRIYLGGEDEYGYMDLSETGTLRYHCLSDKVDDKFKNLGNMFDFYETDDALYMRGDNHILIKRGENYQLVTSKEGIYASTMSGGTLYLATDNGLKQLGGGNKLTGVKGAGMLGGKRINVMVPYRNGILIPTATEGLFYYKDGVTVPYTTQVDDVLKSSTICCAAIKGDTLAVGTIRSGLLIINLSNGSSTFYDETRGMQSNMVQSVAFDAHGNVWCGLDYGIDYIELGAPFTYLYRSPQSYGIGYTSYIYNNMAYFGTDRGLYVSAWPVPFNNGRPEMYEVSGMPSGTAWNLFVHDGELFCLHDKGIFTISGGKAQRITNILGAWAYQDIKDRRDLIFVGLYSGVALMKKVNGTWVSLGMVKGIDMPARYMSYGYDNTLVIYNPNTGMSTSFRLDSSLRKVVSQSVSSADSEAKRRHTGGKMLGEWDIMGNILRINEYESIAPYAKGFLLYDTRKIRMKTQKVSIHSMYITNRKDSLVYSSNFMGKKSTPEIRYKDNSVRLEYAMMRLITKVAVTYRYRLNNGKWSEWSTQTSKEYSNLMEGDYTFEVCSKTYDGKISTDSISFTVLPPWYRSIIAYILYVLSAFTGVAMLIKFENRRLERQKAQALRKKNEEVHMLKDEIDHLEQEKIELELKHKSQEIADLILINSRKNEILNSIKDDVHQVALRLNKDSVSESKRQLLVISGEIDTSIKSDDMMKRFEEQFDLVNNNLIAKLRQLYPNLTHNELLMCAYLKMNLQTKEIAPLLNMSVRGVETIRYRLRKKFGIDRSQNLLQFLNGI